MSSHDQWSIHASEEMSWQFSRSISAAMAFSAVSGARTGADWILNRDAISARSIILAGCPGWQLMVPDSRRPSLVTTIMVFQG